MLCLSFVYLIQTMVKLSFWFSEQGPFKVFSSAVYSDSEKKKKQHFWAQLASFFWNVLIWLT